MEKVDIDSLSKQLNHYFNNTQNNNDIIDSKQVNNNIQIINENSIPNETNIKQFMFEQIECLQNVIEKIDSLKRMKSNLHHKTKDTINKYKQMREKQLQDQIKILKEDIFLLQTHFDVLNKMYQQKREEANQNLLNFVSINEKYLYLQSQYEKLEDQYTKKQTQIMNNYNRQIQQNNLIQLQKQQKYQTKILELEMQVQSLQSLISQIEKQYQLIKGLLNSEVTKRKIKENQTIQQFELLTNQIQTQKLFILTLRKQLQEKTQQLIANEQNISLLQKSLKQVNKRLIQKETESKKQIMKERSITKKALDSLQITKKYSQIELSKSRKKQKMYLNSQKQLIYKIKQICKDQSVLDTSENSTRKSLEKSLNTTLKSIKNDKKNVSVSPFVSKFREYDDPSLQLSPIHKIAPFKSQTYKFSDQSKQNNSLNSYRSVPQIDHMKRKIQIPTFISAEPCFAGTPCFEVQNKSKMFRAMK